MYQKPKTPPKTRTRTDSDLREDGKVLIQNGLKARSIAIDSVEAYIVDNSKTADKNWGCYMLQQSMELTLKGLIRYYYEDFRVGHFIMYNAQTLMELEATHIELREIDDILSRLNVSISKTLYKWESISRYKELRVNKADIELVDDMSERLCQFIRRHGYLNDEVDKREER